MTAPCRVNVNNIHIPKPSRIFVKPGTKGAPRFILGCPKGLKDLKGLTADWPALAPPGLFGRARGGQSKIRDLADKSALRPRADLRPTSAACGAPHRRAQTA